MERTGVLGEAISPELVLVDGELAVRARDALPHPPWLQPAAAEARQRPEVRQAVAVKQRTAPKASEDQPSFSRQLWSTALFGCALVALVALVSLTLDFVSRPAKPTLAPRRAGSAAPAAPNKSTSKQAAKHASAQSAVKPKASRTSKSKPVPTESRGRSVAPASPPKQAAKPKTRVAVKVERAFSWRLYRGAAYYEVLLRRGATTIYAVRTVKRTASIHLKLRPGKYHAVVRPAIPNEAGIILGPAIMDKIVRV